MGDEAKGTPEEEQFQGEEADVEGHRTTVQRTAEPDIKGRTAADLAAEPDVEGHRFATEEPKTEGDEPDVEAHRTVPRTTP